MMPRLADYRFRDYCAAAAAHLLRGREANYPGMIEAGKITVEASEEAQQLLRALVAQWRWVMDPTKPLRPAWGAETGYFGRHNWLLVDELATIVTRARAQADREPSFKRREMADLCEALAWHQQPLSGRSGDAQIVVMVSAERVVDVFRAGKTRLAA